MPSSRSPRVSIPSSRRSPSPSPRRPPGSGRGRRRHQLRRRRAGLRHARRTSRTPPRGARQGRGQVHRRRRPAAAAQGDRRRAVARPPCQARGRATCWSRPGAKHSLFNLFMALLDPGDEVLIPAPYWVSYPDMVMLAGGTPVILDDQGRGRLHGERGAGRARHARRGPARSCSTTRRTRPARSTRARRSRRSPRSCVDKDLLVISDDIYRSLVYGDARVRLDRGGLARSSPMRTILSTACRKTYAMTGWRIGYTATAAALAPLIKAMSKIQGQSTSNPTHVAQIATLAALTGPQEPRRDHAQGVRRAPRRDGQAAARDPRREVPRAQGRVLRVPGYLGVRRQDARPRASRSTTMSQLCDWLVEVGRSRSCRARGFGAPGLRPAVVRVLDGEHPGGRRPARSGARNVDVIRALVLGVVLACGAHDQDGPPGANGNGNTGTSERARGAVSDGHAVVIHLSAAAIEVEGAHGKHTFPLAAGAPDPGLVPDGRRHDPGGWRQERCHGVGARRRPRGVERARAGAGEPSDDDLPARRRELLSQR